MADYYISTTGDNGSNGSITTPWETISKANTTLEAGDTVYIRSGSYSSDYINPSNSGSSGSLITYSNYNDEIVTIINSNYGVLINSKDYIKVNGIICTDLNHQMYIVNGEHNIIQYCIFDGFNTFTWHGSVVWNSSQYNHIHHNVFLNWGLMTGGNDRGSLFEIGLWSVTNDFSDYNLIEENEFYNGGHHVFGAASKYNVIRNNHFHHEPWTESTRGLTGNRCILTEGHRAGTNLYEYNTITHASWPPDDNGAVGIAISSQNNIIRFNSFYHHDAAGIEISNQSPFDNANDNYIYNNVFYHNGDEASIPSAYRVGLYFANWAGATTGQAIKNNIFYANALGAINYGSSSAGNQDVEGNWLEAGDPKFTDISAEPDPSNANLYDFRLQSDSGAINNGVFITQTNGTGSSSTTLIVDDAKYFMDGWGVITGDTIQLEGQTTTAIITDITNNTLTLNTALTWTDGLGVSFPYTGTTPDIGIYEFDAPPPGYPEGTTLIEAESGTLVSPIVEVVDGTASGGKFIRTNTEFIGTATFNFHIANAGIYIIRTRVNCADIGSNSYTVQVDSDSPFIWDIFETEQEKFGSWDMDEINKRGTGSSVAPEQDPYTIYLFTGNHTIIFTGREMDARLDYFIFALVSEDGSSGVGVGTGVFRGVLTGVI